MAEIITDRTIFNRVRFSCDVPNTDIDIPDVAVTFNECNMARVKKKPNWIYVDCQTTQEPIPPEETEDEKDAIYAEYLSGELSKLDPVIVSDALAVKNIVPIVSEVTK